MDDDDDLEQMQELVHRFTLAHKLLQTLEPAGVGARNLPECLGLQLKALLAERPGDADLACAQALCSQSGALELLARHDYKRLAAQLGRSEEQVRAAQRQIARLEPKPGRRFADVEREIIIPEIGRAHV